MSLGHCDLLGMSVMFRDRLGILYCRIRSLSLERQNAYFSANCRILGSSALRILPKLDDLRYVSIAPGRKLLVTLNASARNSILCVSRKRNTRARAISNCHDVGSESVARPRFPRVPKAGIANAAGFRYCVPGRPDLSRYTFGRITSGRWARIWHRHGSVVPGGLPVLLSLSSVTVRSPVPELKATRDPVVALL